MGRMVPTGECRGNVVPAGRGGTLGGGRGVGVVARVPDELGHTWSVTRFFRRRWDESRGDAFNAWGPATYLFEVDDAGWPIRQIEAYDAGPVLRYGPEQVEDDYGGLGQARLDEFEDWSEWEISATDFERVWNEPVA